MKIIHALSITVGVLMGATRTNAAIATTAAELDVYYDMSDTSCTGVPVFVRIFPTCGTSKTVDEVVCDKTDASKTMFCTPNRTEFLGEAHPYVIVDYYDDANCTKFDWCSNAYLADGRCHEYGFSRGDVQLTTIDEDGRVTKYNGCNSSTEVEFEQPATSFNTGECIPDGEGYSAKYYSVGELKPTNATSSADASGSTSATDAPSTTTATPTTNTTASVSTSSATSTPVLCSIVLLLVSTMLSILAAH
ncbi:hypothetical protein PF008_g24875 [Phytophthora fragariae]|uniref:Uncharacterized protein n=1 Tax=Phytophthora fragariae TaxID=53985 RepID=A0A6G0QLS2_9STRA|nr:hypothetical protein PF008_g24875 [Phytophthora fragariae]